VRLAESSLLAVESPCALEIYVCVCVCTDFDCFGPIVCICDGCTHGSNPPTKKKEYSPLEAARKVGGLEDEGEGDEIAHENADEQNVAELTTRRTHHGCVVVSAKRMSR
jgi:hypothetical protein